jgi:ABC-type phosphate/phosphonate transport system substrate-binding protein
MALVANARMYSVTPKVASAWAQLFRCVARCSGIDLDVIEHRYPAPLPALWQREDLGCAFICGFPFMRSFRHLKPIVAPVPVASPILGRAQYATLFVVKADSKFLSLEDTLGHRAGYTATDSHSGYNAPRYHLLPYRKRAGEPLYGETVGPLHTPRRVIKAVEEGLIDVGPLDNYAYDLMLRDDPDLNRRVRVIAATASAPIPFLAASLGVSEEAVETLRCAFVKFGSDPASGEVRETLGLRGFTEVDADAYKVIVDRDVSAGEAGYSLPL